VGPKRRGLRRAYRYGLRLVRQRRSVRLVWQRRGLRLERIKRCGLRLVQPWRYVQWLVLRSIERASERANERVGERASGRANGRASERASDWCERANG